MAFRRPGVYSQACFPSCLVGVIPVCSLHLLCTVPPAANLPAGLQLCGSAPPEAPAVDLHLADLS